MPLGILVDGKQTVRAAAVLLQYSNKPTPSPVLTNSFSIRAPDF